MVVRPRLSCVMLRVAQHESKKASRSTTSGVSWLNQYRTKNNVYRRTRRDRRDRRGHAIGPQGIANARRGRPAWQAEWCGTFDRERTMADPAGSFVSRFDVPATPRCGAASSVSACSARSAFIVRCPLLNHHAQATVARLHSSRMRILALAHSCFDNEGFGRGSSGG